MPNNLDIMTTYATAGDEKIGIMTTYEFPVIAFRQTGRYFGDNIFSVFPLMNTFEFLQNIPQTMFIMVWLKLVEVMAWCRQKPQGINNLTSGYWLGTYTKWSCIVTYLGTLY